MISLEAIVSILMQDKSFISQNALQIQVSQMQKNKRQLQIEQINTVCNEDNCYKEKIVLAKNPQKKQLIDALKLIKANKAEENKMVNLTGLANLVKYCDKFSVDCKLFCKKLLIREIDKTKKKLRYCSQEQVSQLLKAIALSLQNRTDPGEITLQFTCKEITEIVKEKKEKDSKIIEDLIYTLYKQRKIDPIKWHYGQQFPEEIPNSVVERLQRIQKKIRIKEWSNRIVPKEIGNIVRVSGMTRVLKEYAKKEIEQIRLEKIEMIRKYAVAIPEINKLGNKIRKINILSGCFHTFCQHRKFQKIRAFKEIKTKIHSFLDYLKFMKESQLYSLTKIQRNVLAYLKYKSGMEKNQLIYLQEHQQQYQNNIKKYSQLTQDINQLLQNSHLPNHSNFYSGVLCYIQIIHIQNWGNTNLFAPESLRQFFQSSLKKQSKQKHEILTKIEIEGPNLSLTCLSGHKYSLGVSQNSSLQFQSSCFQTQKGKRFEFYISSQGELFVRGQNLYGQLGVGQEIQSSENWLKVHLRGIVKHADNRFRKTVCVTNMNQIYHWGAVQGKILRSPTLIEKPYFLKYKNILQVNSTAQSILVLTECHQIFDIYKNSRVKLLSFKKQVDDRALITTGNEYLQITYGIGIKIECYDEVRKKKMSRWLKENSGLGSRKENEDQILIEQDKQNNSNIFNTTFNTK